MLKVKILHYSGDVPAEVAADRTEIAARHYHFSRQALALALEELGRRPEKYPQVKDHLCWESDPSAVVSLAHTKTAAVGMAGESSAYLSVGVDLESVDREINPEGHRHFVNDDDDVMLSDLQIWSVKEAAFKALAPVLEKFSHDHSPLVLKKIWLKESSFGLTGHKDALGEYSLEEVDVAGKKFLLAKAWIPAGME